MRYTNQRESKGCHHVPGQYESYWREPVDTEGLMKMVEPLLKNKQGNTWRLYCR
jgi:hypothetical protein